MANDKEFLDLFIRLKGDFAKLDKLKSSGLNIKVNLDFSKANGGGFAKLEKMMKGIDIKVNLQIKGLDRLEKLQKNGITLRTSQGSSKSSGSGSPRGSKAQTQQEFNADQVSRLNKLADSESKRRKTETDRQLKQLFEAQSFRDKQNKANDLAILNKKKSAKALYESDLLNTQNRQENLAKSSTKNRRQDTDRQLKQGFEAQAYRNKQRQIKDQLDLAKKQAAKDLFESNLLRDQNRQEALAKKSTTQRRQDTDRQLKQRFESQDFKAKQADSDASIVEKIETKANKLRRADSNRQLNQAFEAQQFRAKQELSKVNAGIAFNQAIAPRSDINQERDRLEAIDAYNRKAAPFSNINQREIDRKAQEKSFRNTLNRKRAQERFDLLPAFANFHEEGENIAYEHGLLPSDLKGGRPTATKLSKLTRGGLDERRLKGAGKEIGFAGLFGAQAGFAQHGLLGGIIGGIGGLSGGAAGGLVNGKEGAFIGATGAEIGLQAFFHAIEGLKEKLLDASRAGFAFEESILGISSVFQATTTLRGAGGESLGVGAQLKFQEGKARQVQGAARKKLLPLGIGGETEVALVQGIITGFAQKGIQLSPEEVATLSSRIGGAIQAQRPDLLANTNRLRLETEGSISNPGKITALTPILRAFAPSLGKATSGQEALKFTAGLEAFPQTLTSNTDSVVQAFRQFNTELENTKVIFGSDFLRAITPSIERFTKALKESDVQKSLTSLADSLGGFFSFIIDAATRITEELGKLQKGQGSEAAGRTGGVTVGGIGGAIAGGLLGIPGGVPGILAGAAIGGLGGAELGSLGGKFAQEAEKKRKEKEAKDKAEADKNKGVTSQTSASTLINSLLGDATSGKGVLKLVKANLAAEFVKLAAKEFRDTLKDSANKIEDEKQRSDALASIGSQVQLSTRAYQSNIVSNQLEGLRENFNQRKGTFDTTLASGQASSAKFDIFGLGQERSLLLKERRLIKAEIDAIKVESRDATPENKKKINFLVNQENKLQEARERENQTNLELIKNTNAVAEAARRLDQAFGARLQELLSGTDQDTLVGQGQALKFRKQETDARIANLRKSFNNGQIGLEEFRLKSNQFDVAKKQQARETELQPFGDANAFLSAEKAVFDFTHLQEDLNAQLRGYELALEGAKLSVIQAAIAESKAARALDEFAEDKSLERQGLEGRKIAAAEKIVAAGGETPFGVNSALVKGSANFSQDARDLFDQSIAEKEFGKLVTESRSFDQRSLEDQRTAEIAAAQAKIQSSLSALGVTKAQRDLDFQPIQAAGQTISSLEQLVRLRQTLPEGSNEFKKVDETIGSNSVKGSLEDLGFKDFKSFSDSLEQKRQVESGAFNSIGDSESFPALNPVIHGLDAIKSILLGILSAVSGGKGAPFPLGEAGSLGSSSTGSSSAGATSVSGGGLGGSFTESSGGITNPDLGPIFDNHVKVGGDNIPVKTSGNVLGKDLDGLFQKNDASPGFVERLKQGFTSLPPGFQKFVKNAGIKIRAASVESKVFPEVKGLQPSGYPKGSTSDDVGASYRSKDLFFGEKVEGKSGISSIAGTFKHELGHAFDDILGANRKDISDSDEYRKAYEADLKNSKLSSRANEYYRQPGKRGRQETFAELLADHFGGTGTGSSGSNGVDGSIVGSFPNAAKIVDKAIKKSGLESPNGPNLFKNADELSNHIGSLFPKAPDPQLPNTFAPGEGPGELGEQYTSPFKELEVKDLSTPALSDQEYVSPFTESPSLFATSVIGGAAGGSIQPDVFSKDSLASARGKKFVTRPAASTGLSDDERVQFASDISEALTGAGKTYGSGIQTTSTGLGTGAAIFGGLLGSSPEEKLKSKVAELAQTSTNSNSSSGTQPANPADGLLQSINTLISVMSTANPQAIGNQVKSALNSTFAGN